MHAARELVVQTQWNHGAVGNGICYQPKSVCPRQLPHERRCEARAWMPHGSPIDPLATTEASPEFPFENERLRCDPSTSGKLQQSAAVDRNFPASRERGSIISVDSIPDEFGGSSGV